MTKEMAINILRGDVLGTNEQTHEAVFMAIKALKEKAQVDNDRLIWESEIKKREHDVVLKDGAKHRCFDTTMLTEIPTVDAVEVVCCKDCIHYYADPWGWGNCMFEGGVSRRTKESDFCSWGERREDAENN